MKIIASSPAPLYRPLPGTDMRRAYIPADRTDVAETFRQFSTIHVSAAYADDYDMNERTAHLDMIGEFAK